MLYVNFEHRYFKDTKKFDKQIRNVLSDEEIVKEIGECDMIWVRKYSCMVLVLSRLGTTLNRVSILVNHVNTFFSNLDDNHYKNVQCRRISNISSRFKAIARFARLQSHFGNAGMDQPAFADD